MAQGMLSCAQALASTVARQEPRAELRFLINRELEAQTSPQALSRGVGVLKLGQVP
jgi:hypothetical protein